MRAVSLQFLDALRFPHILATELMLVDPVTGPRPLEVLDGQVVLDRSSQQRGRGSATISNESLPVTPYGSEVEVRTGLQWPDGSLEMLLVGTLRVDNVVTDVGTSTTSLDLVDRSQQVADSQLLAPRVYHLNDRIEDAIRDLLDVLPGITITTPGHTEKFSVVTVVDKDRWAAILDMATALGCDAYFDGGGDFILADVPDFSAAPVWSVDAGQFGVMVQAQQTDTRQGVYNGVQAEGHTLTNKPPVSALATDDDPNSPTLWGGPFGKVPTFIQSESITTTAQALRAAQAQLATLLGRGQTVALGSVPNPALEPDDAITVVYPDETAQAHLVDAVTVPLGLAPMTLRTRSQP